MPANKNAYIRYKALDECFRDWGKQYTWEKLQDYVERAVAKEGVTQVSISTLRADVNFMKSEAGGYAPIKTYHDGHVVYLRYDDPDFSILQQEITPRELKQLTDTVEMLSRFKGNQHSISGMCQNCDSRPEIFECPKCGQTYWMYSDTYDWMCYDGHCTTYDQDYDF